LNRIFESKMLLDTGNDSEFPHGTLHAGSRQGEDFILSGGNQTAVSEHSDIICPQLFLWNDRNYLDAGDC